MPLLIQTMMRFLNILIIVILFTVSNAGYLGVYPRGCDEDAALQCEYDFLLCKLFGGPANDKPTLCRCASEFYGSCLRLAGVSELRNIQKMSSLYFVTSVRRQMK